MLEKISAKFTFDQKLLYSMIYGWGVISFFLIIRPLSATAVDGIGKPSEMLSLGFLATAILLSMRYSMFKPMLGLASEGVRIVSFAYIFGLLFDRRNSGYLAIGAFIGALFVLIIVLFINAFISLFYLIKETYTYFTMKKESSFAAVAAGKEDTMDTIHHVDERPLIQQKMLDEGVQEIITPSYIEKYLSHMNFANIAHEYYRGDNDTYFMWNWFSRSEEDPFLSNNRVMMIGGKEKKRQEFITNFCKTKFAADDLSVFRITFDNSKSSGEEQWLGGVLRHSELIPGNQLVSEEFIKQDSDFGEFKDVTLNARKFFAETYFHLFADLKGLNIEQLFPNGVSFDQEKESPLDGYIDAAEHSPYSDELFHLLNDFGTKSWTKTESGYIRNISPDSPPNQKALLLFETIWEMYTIPGYFAGFNQPHHFVFHVDIPDEVMPTAYHQEVFREALKYLVWRSEWKNYHMSIIGTIDKPNRFLTLPFNQQVLFNREHVSHYKEMTNITINPQQSQVLTSIEPGTCCWVDLTQHLALGLRLRYNEKIFFSKKEEPQSINS